MVPVRRILLADDDRSLRLGVADLMVGLGLEVLHAETALEAIEVGRAARLHAALLDLNMPDGTGLEVLPELRLVHVGLPCLIYSGDLTSNLERSALEAGAFAVLHKPVDPGLLRQEVVRALSSSAA